MYYLCFVCFARDGNLDFLCLQRTIFFLIYKKIIDFDANYGPTKQNKYRLS